MAKSSREVLFAFENIRKELVIEEPISDKDRHASRSTMNGHSSLLSLVQTD